MALDPRRLLTFRAVARLGSFSRAAEDLSLTQSAVSQQVAALERQLGLRLLDRGRGGVRPTPAGQTLLEHAGALEQRLDLASAQLAELADEAGRELRVGAFPSALATLVPAAAARLLAGRPDLRITLAQAELATLVAGVREGTLHAAVCFQDAAAPRREHAGTRRQDLVEDEMVLALPPRHRLARRRAVALADLAGDPWMAPSRDGIVVRACRDAGFEPRVAILASDALAIRAVVAAGLAVTLTPRLIADGLYGTRIADVAGPAPRRALYALLPDAGAHPLARVFLEELRAGADGL
jgi:DNA-binding transcriptional LysR family regulator